MEVAMCSTNKYLVLIQDLTTNYKPIETSSPNSHSKRTVQREGVADEIHPPVKGNVKQSLN